jgi:hypothetical protein
LRISSRNNVAAITAAAIQIVSTHLSRMFAFLLFLVMLGTAASANPDHNERIIAENDGVGQGTRLLPTFGALADIRH